MMRKRPAFAAIVGATCALATLMTDHAAQACGGCFHPPTQNVSDITDERMLLSVSPTQTTLYDQIRYSGTPSQFAWVLPIKGTVTVGLSADVLFDTMDALTATQIVPPDLGCAPAGGGCAFGGSSSATSFNGGSGGSVTVTKQENVGPYATVQLHSTDPKALDTWLLDNGFEIPADVENVIGAYVGQGFDFLAMKLLPNQGILAMRPVRVTMPGAALSLPLRMAAVGTGASVGITLWVVADGRYEPQNFPFFRIEDKDLVWDWNTSLSNYATLRSAAAAPLFGRGWEIESSIDLNAVAIQNAIRSGGQTNGAGGTGSGSSSSADQDYLPVGDDDAGIGTSGAGDSGSVASDGSAGDAGADDAGTVDDGGSFDDAGTAVYETAEQVRDDDLAALLHGANATGSSTVRVTRMRADLTHAAMSADLVLQASADQTELPNVRFVTRSVNKPDCPGDGGCDTPGRPIVGSAGIFSVAILLAFARVIRRRRRY